ALFREQVPQVLRLALAQLVDCRLEPDEALRDFRLHGLAGLLLLGRGASRRRQGQADEQPTACATHDHQTGPFARASARRVRSLYFLKRGRCWQARTPNSPTARWTSS